MRRWRIDDFEESADEGGRGSFYCPEGFFFLLLVNKIYRRFSHGSITVDGKSGVNNQSI